MSDLVFISYARHDGCKHAERLDDALPRHGFTTWRDVRGIDPAKDFTAEIEQAIDASQYVVACITPDVRRGDSFVRREIQYALIAKKPVIVARFEDVPPPINVVNNTWVDFVGRDWNSAFRDLCTYLGMDPADLPTTAPQHDPFRAYVQWLYERMTRFLDQAVIRLIDVDVEDDPDKVAPPPRRVQPRDIIDQRYLPMGAPPTEDDTPSLPAGRVGVGSPEFTTFQQAFEHYNGRVLLLGDPGAGKSITLMAHARDAAAVRLDDPTAPLPIFAIIPTWNAEQQTPLAEWLAEGHDDLRQTALERVLDAGDALLLLDGLDELGNTEFEKQIPVKNEETGEQEIDEETGEPITEVILVDPRNEFLAQIPANNRVVISCRVEEYTQINTRAALTGAVTLQPLTDAQIRAYLEGDPDLLAAVEADDDLKQMVRSPLIMSLFAFAYRDQGENAAQLRDLRQSPAALRNFVFGRYVEARYRWENEKHGPLAFEPDEIHKVLSHVATENILWGRENVLLYQNFVAGVAKLGSKPVEIFLSLVGKLNLVHASGEDTFRFVHLLLRLHFANVNRLIAALHEKDSWVRSIAAEVLGHLGDTRAIEPLITALGDKDWDVSQKAASALVQIGKAAIKLLIVALRVEDKNIRRKSAEVLGRIGDMRAVEPLNTALRDVDVWVRREVVKVLWQLDDDRAVEPLIAALRDEDANVRRSAAGVLRKFGDARAVEPLIAALRDEDANVRHEVVDALGEFGDTRAVEPLIAVLHDVDWRVRRKVISVLEQLGDVRAVEPLIAALHDVDMWVRSDAAEALGKFGDTRAVEPLIAVFGDKDEWLRDSAVEALVRIRYPAVKPLIAALRHEDELVRRSAANALERIETPEAREATRQWRKKTTDDADDSEFSTTKLPPLRTIW